MSLQEINPNEFYTPRKLVNMNILPWKGVKTFDRKLKLPFWSDIFKPMYDNTNGRIKTHIKGENIIKFQQMAANGTLNK